MINTEIKAHDKYSVEFKIGYIVDNKLKDINEYRTKTWIFVPGSLGINRETYLKYDFYRNTKNYIRLITPVYTLSDILIPNKGPFFRLQKAIDTLLESSTAENIEKFSYQIKMLDSILKSALRQESADILKEEDDEKTIAHVQQFVENVNAITSLYREKELLLPASLPQECRAYFSLGDDFLGNIIEQYTFVILRGLKLRKIFKQTKDVLSSLVEKELAHKKARRFLYPMEGNEKRNSTVIARRNVLKKFVESDLFLKTEKKQDGAFARQFYYSIAAGLAMIFATVISFFATQRYGNFTSTLFIALVVSYIFKDRIKELSRYYFSSKLDKKYYDNKSKLSIRHQEIGWIKEGFDFINEQSIPKEIEEIRAQNISQLEGVESSVYGESVLLYRKYVKLSREDLEKYKEYRLSGINDITRFNILNFILKMDDPVIPLYLPDNENGYKEVGGEKLYPLYFVLQCESDQNVYYKKYKILFNRNGISDATELY